jgi:hypothetical protein
MRLNYLRFLNGLDKRIQEKFSVFLEMCKTEDLAVITKLLAEESLDHEAELKYIRSDPVLVLPKLSNRREMMKYAILSWWMPEYTGFNVRQDLLQRGRRYSFPEIEVYLQSKEICVLALMRRTDFQLNDLYGNILIPEVTKKITLEDGTVWKKQVPDWLSYSFKKPRRARKAQRKRGYNDQGSLPTNLQKDQKIIRYEESQDLIIEYERRIATERYLVLTRILILKEILSRECLT